MSLERIQVESCHHASVHELLSLDAQMSQAKQHSTNLPLHIFFEEADPDVQDRNLPRAKYKIDFLKNRGLCITSLFANKLNSVLITPGDDIALQQLIQLTIDNPELNVVFVLQRVTIEPQQAKHSIISRIVSDFHYINHNSVEGPSFDGSDLVTNYKNRPAVISNKKIFARLERTTLQQLLQRKPIPPVPVRLRVPEKEGLHRLALVIMNGKNEIVKKDNAVYLCAFDPFICHIQAKPGKSQQLPSKKDAVIIPKDAAQVEKQFAQEHYQHAAALWPMLYRNRAISTVKTVSHHDQDTIFETDNFIDSMFIDYDVQLEKNSILFPSNPVLHSVWIRSTVLHCKNILEIKFTCQPQTKMLLTAIVIRINDFKTRLPAFEEMSDSSAVSASSTTHFSGSICIENQLQEDYRNDIDLEIDENIPLQLTDNSDQFPFHILYSFPTKSHSIKKQKI